MVCKTCLLYTRIIIIKGVILGFYCLFLRYYRQDTTSNIIHNSIIIVNGLWYLNVEKMKYAEEVAAALVIVGFVYAIRRIIMVIIILLRYSYITNR